MYKMFVTFSQYSPYVENNRANSNNIIEENRKESRFLYAPFRAPLILYIVKQGGDLWRQSGPQKLIAEYVNVNRIRTWLMIFEPYARILF